tara:strand:+ start:786 stop:1469 length:684 start_codon:yes stop_codon:yes gene_type:complete
MKKILILNTGSSLKQVVKKFGQSTDWIMNSFPDNQVEFKIVDVYKGEKFKVSEGDAWIITGSSDSVYENKPWMLNLEKLIYKRYKLNKKILGICFGHQIVAQALGGKVIKNPQGWELGSRTVFLTQAGKESQYFKNINCKAIVYESHQDVVIDVPDNSIELAYNDMGNQAFLIDEHIIGLQFHPEFSFDVIKEYALIRTNLGVKVDNLSLIESDSGKIFFKNYYANL